MSISEQEAQELVSKFLELKNKYNESKSNKDKRELIKHENVLVEKFKYMVHSRTYPYKKFSNYDDLNQDGYEALVMGLKNYDKTKGSIFWWLHKYIDTRVYRSANSYSTVRIPMAVAKNNPPKMTTIPLSTEDYKSSPEEILLNKSISKKLDSLNVEDYDLVTNIFGIGKDKLTIDEYNKKTGIKKSKINYKIKNILKKLQNY